MCVEIPYSCDTVGQMFVPISMKLITAMKPLSLPVDKGCSCSWENVVLRNRKNCCYNISSRLSLCLLNEPVSVIKIFQNVGLCAKSYL